MTKTSRDPDAPIDLQRRRTDADHDEPVPLSRPKQRSYVRVPLEVEVSLSSDSHFYAGLTGDISRGGLFVATYTPLRPGDTVMLRFTLLDEVIEVEGVVRWRREAADHSPPGVGVAFRELSPRERATIEAFCKARAALYYDLEDDIESGA